MRLFFHKATVDAHFYRGYLDDNEEICEALEAGQLDRAGDLLLAYLDRSEAEAERRPRRTVEPGAAAPCRRPATSAGQPTVDEAAELRTDRGLLLNNSLRRLFNSLYSGWRQSL